MDFVWRLPARAAMMWPLFRGRSPFVRSKEFENREVRNGQIQTAHSWRS